MIAITCREKKKSRFSFTAGPSHKEIRAEFSPFVRKCETDVKLMTKGT